MTDNRTKVLFVCTTNTTRSVMAQFILDRFGYSRFDSSSAGIFASGIPMSNKLAEVLAQKGYSKSSVDEFKTSQIDENRIKNCDAVYCVTDYHKTILEEKYPEYSDKFRTFSFDLPDVSTTEQIDSLLYRLKEEMLKIFSLREDNLKTKMMDEKSLELSWELEKETFAHPFPKLEADSESIKSIAVYSYDVFCGYINYRTVLDESEIMTIAVRKEFRRHGLGNVLIKAFEEECRKNGIKSIYLEARKTNVAARTMYEHFGFEQIGFRKNYYDSPVDDGILYRYIVPEE
ncbi:MAG: ribosomal protein S18-alanine N-acetyltransferase [Clostridiales bacterium]|nr:ribosomal protein S18-alanine N-acetyltransferase [Clostridiales bacterium]